MESSSPAHPADDDRPAAEAEAEPTADTTARASPALVALEAKTSQLIDAATARKDPELFMRHLRQALEALVALKKSLSAKPHEPKPHEAKSAPQHPQDADDDDANDDNDATLLEGVAWAEVQRQFEASYVEKKSTPASLASAAGLQRPVMDALIRRARFFCGPIHRMYPHNFAKLVRAVSELSERSPDEPRDAADDDDDDDDDASAGADADAGAAAADDQDQDAAASRPNPRMFLRVGGLSSDWARMSGADDGAAASEREREAELVALFRSADHPQLSQQQPYRALSVAFSREGEAPSQDDDTDARGGGGAERSTEVVAYVKFGHPREAAQAMRDLQVAVRGSLAWSAAWIVACAAWGAWGEHGPGIMSARRGTRLGRHGTWRCEPCRQAGWLNGGRAAWKARAVVRGRLGGCGRQGHGIRMGSWQAQHRVSVSVSLAVCFVAPTIAHRHTTEEACVMSCVRAASAAARVMCRAPSPPSPPS